MFKLKRINKKKKAFTLIEVIIALGLLGIIAIFIFPSFRSIYKNSRTNRNQARVIFALEEAIETSKDKEISDFTYSVNDIDVKVSISSYPEDLDFKEIVASYEGKELKLVVKK
ncbi:MAG: competence type IV pilus minor pilin ComGE [Peptoniphilaceae bacterium]|nr:competence type IV pilus minor pilin ComGE [Peptoniphilaceae bacterium]